MRLNTVYLIGRSIVLPPNYDDCIRVLENPAAALKSRFERPLILGASISANLKTRGPADRALTQLGLGHVEPMRLAANGQTSRELVEKLVLPHFERASVVLAIDMFFWDATLPSLKRSLSALERFVELTKTFEVPVVVATIPEVAWWPFQAVRSELNLALRSAAARHPHFKLLDLETINHDLQRDGGFTLGNRRYTLEEVAPDGLHLSAYACEYLAERLLALF